MEKKQQGQARKLYDECTPISAEDFRIRYASELEYFQNFPTAYMYPKGAKTWPEA